MNPDVTIEGLLAHMRRLSDAMAPTDTRKPFHDTYLRTTEAVARAIDAGHFLDGAWVERWDVIFAGFYVHALELHLADKPPPGPWQVALGAGAGRRIPPLRLLLLGMNAHINFDLPQSLLAAISDAEWGDHELISRRAADHGHIDDILASRVAAEDGNLKALEQPGDRTLLDRLLKPFNHLATKRFLTEARAKVWHNARVLENARQAGTLDEEITRLEALSRRRVEDLVQPGQVVLELALRGFGVTLEPPT